MTINTDNLAQRFVMTPDGKGWMMGYDRTSHITVHFSPVDGNRAGVNRVYAVSECEEIDEQPKSQR